MRNWINLFEAETMNVVRITFKFTFGHGEPTFQFTRYTTDVMPDPYNKLSYSGSMRKNGKGAAQTVRFSSDKLNKVECGGISGNYIEGQIWTEMGFEAAEEAIKVAVREYMKAEAQRFLKIAQEI